MVALAQRQRIRECGAQSFVLNLIEFLNFRHFRSF